MDASSPGRLGPAPCLGSALAIAALLLAGCASSPSATPAPPLPVGETSYQAVAKDGIQHYQLALGEISTGAAASHHPAPVYPPELLPARLPAQEVEALLVVDTEGKVSEVRIAEEAQADPQRRLFAQAVRAAAEQWTFEPLRISRWASDANGNTHEVDREARPFSMTYVFHFAWKDGQPMTDVSAPANGAR